MEGYLRVAELANSGESKSEGESVKPGQVDSCSVSQDEPWPFENASIAGTTTVAVDGTVRTAASTFSNLRNNSGAAKMRQEKLRAIKHNLLLGAAGIIGVAAVSSAYWSKVAKRF